MNSRGGSALQDGVDGGEDHGRVLAAGGGEAGQGGDAAWRRSRCWGRCGRRAPCPRPGTGSPAPWARRTRGPRPSPPAAGRRGPHAAAAAAPGAGGGLLGQPRQHQRHQPVRHAGQHLARPRGAAAGAAGAVVPVVAASAITAQSVKRAQLGDQLARTRRPARSPGAGSCPAGRGRAAAAGARTDRATRAACAGQPRLGEPAEQPVHFLGAAMARAINGAPAAAFDVVGHDSSALITGRGRLTAPAAAATFAASGPSYRPAGANRKAPASHGGQPLARARTAIATPRQGV